ncbi:hypothetical protein [Mucilaginibacter pedocola]|uniref:Uncharacterized protein n=1 Tax=Mucilaginibacter pedocola TaxID=1792845 RepID=A0A1S9PBE6_9SPHI|nr:hypothetical protein [Mucilaginibacter pedocola]OOQ58303.1 hypothetical protein BC343_11760 [Mucilaginibacter pedocola]
MTPIAERFLQIFKDTNTARNAILMPQVITLQVNKWPFELREKAGEAYQTLADEEYLTFEHNKYKLLDKGFDHLYADQSIAQTRQLVLGLFEKNNLKPGHILPHGVLNSARLKWNAYHQEKLGTTLTDLQKEGDLGLEQLGYRLLK